MANFNGTILTQAGRNLLAKALTGAKLEFTKVQLGDGVWDANINPETLTSLISPKIDLPINDIQMTGDGTVRLRVLLTNTGLTEGFFTRELGIFAKDPNTEEEVLYSVAYAENPDYIPADGVTKVENVFDVYTVVANAQNVTAVISDTVVLATKQDIEVHNNDANSHPDIRQKLDELQNQIEGITPDIQNAINQHNQDPNAHEDIRQLIQNFLEQFDANLSSPGYCKFPYGLIIQWGIVYNTNDADFWIPFPISFPNKCLSVVITISDSWSVATCPKIHSKWNNNGFQIVIRDGYNNLRHTDYVHWVAIGY